MKRVAPAADVALRPTVAILHRRLTHYRVPLFERLRARLALDGIDLLLVHGQPAPAEASKRDEGSLPWAIRVENRYLTVRGTTLCWQPVVEAVRRAKLVVLTQESSILSNYLLLAGPRATRRVAYWGHGANLQSRAPDGLRERWKRHWTHRVDWWFAYTSTTVQRLAAGGYPAERITCLDNSVDTQGWRAALARVSDDDVDSLRARHGIEPGAPIGVYCGSLYAEKKPHELIDAALRIREREPRLQLTMIGDGPMMAQLRERARDLPWLRLTGAQHGADKAAWFRAATLVLNPGAVGLAVLDAFAAGLPLVTMRGGLHGPEVAYLRHGENGLLTDDSVDAYADAVADLLADPQRRRSLASRALADAARYSLDNMVEHFRDGIVRALRAA